MRTVVISDLHLGASSRADLLRRPSIRERLLPALAGADQIVLLGDVVDLRDGPLADVLETTRPFFEDLRERAPEAELVIVPGNHDHQLLEPWLRRRRMRAKRRPIGLEERISPTGDAVGKLAKWAGPERTMLSYPGLSIRDDVYATHGHYLDSHVTTPTLERLGIGALAKFTRRSSDGPRSPEDYERHHAPLYALLFALAQGSSAVAASPTSTITPSMRAWQVLGGASGTARTIRGKILGSTILPGAIKLIGRAGLGKLSADLSLDQLGRAGVRAMAEVIEHLEIDADHVIFGHTHRRGPLPAETERIAEAERLDEWQPGGMRLYNCGSWVYSPTLIATDGQRSGFWPGTMVEVEGQNAPRAQGLLTDMTEVEIHDALRAEE